MKIAFYLIAIILIWQLTSCSEQMSSSSEEETTKITAPIKPDSIVIKKADTIPNEQKDTIVVEELLPMPTEYYYVNTKSGINYHETPNGKVLGSFPLNKQIGVFKHTGVFEDVINDKDTLKTEWLGVENGLDTVYVLHSFLSESFSLSRLGIYITLPYDPTSTQYQRAFLNLSERYPWSMEDSLPLIPKEKLGQKEIKLTKEDYTEFLKRARLSTTDTVFIFNLETDSVYKFLVGDCSLICQLDAYSEEGNEYTVAYQYELGLNLGQKYVNKGLNFTYVGKNNIFQTGHAKPIIWKKIPTNQFPNQFKSKFTAREKNRTRGLIPIQSYQFTNDTLDYSIQDLGNKSGGLGARYLVITEKNTGKLLFSQFFTETEGTYLNPLFIEGEKRPYQHQWTGAIFKNKPTMIYGFLGNSFGCPSIKFVGNTEPPIYIGCDNRH